jgi:NADPH:quinone reductase-like Zn-dependent oxidoreductase
MAKRIGARVFATVGLKAKQALLVGEYGIPEAQIFSSRDTSFAKSIMWATGGQAVDVVINWLTGEGLPASWEYIAPYGHFVEIGKKDIISNSSLPT